MEPIKPAEPVTNIVIKQSISTENIPGKYFILHIVQTTVVAVGDDGVAHLLEFGKVIDNRTSKERSTFLKRGIGDDGLPIPPYRVYNIGNSHPESLLDFVQILQEELVRAGVLPADYDFKTHEQLVPMQPGDVPVTYADATDLERDFGFKPQTSLREGLKKFAEWYNDYYK